MQYEKSHFDSLTKMTDFHFASPIRPKIAVSVENFDHRLATEIDVRLRVYRFLEWCVSATSLVSFDLDFLVERRSVMSNFFLLGFFVNSKKASFFS